MKRITLELGSGGPCMVVKPSSLGLSGSPDWYSTTDLRYKMEPEDISYVSVGGIKAEMQWSCESDLHAKEEPQIATEEEADLIEDVNNQVQFYDPCIGTMRSIPNVFTSKDKPKVIDDARKKIVLNILWQVDSVQLMEEEANNVDRTSHKFSKYHTEPSILQVFDMCNLSHVVDFLHLAHDLRIFFESVCHQSPQFVSPGTTLLVEDNQKLTSVCPTNLLDAISDRFLGDTLLDFPENVGVGFAFISSDHQCVSQDLGLPQVRLCLEALSSHRAVSFFSPSLFPLKPGFALSVSRRFPSTSLTSASELYSA
uniref:Uncharacterized protein n=2 Tax=Timema TaxID=61471 RepID=A0A7R9II30_9NEOP|nr:unnamed protein product [Timema tahoe]